MTKTAKWIREEVGHLSAANINSDGRMVDWSATLDENMGGWRSYEAVTCDECGQVLVMLDLGECHHNEFDESSKCKGYINSEGPMMNYFYPADFRMSCEKAAKLCAGSCIVVELENGDTGFALAGGGMDFSWDIAESYVACGLLPPAWIRLPMFASMTLTRHSHLIIEACRETAKTMISRMEFAIADLDQLTERLRANGKKHRREKK